MAKSYLSEEEVFGGASPAGNGYLSESEVFGTKPKPVQDPSFFDRAKQGLQSTVAAGQIAATNDPAEVARLVAEEQRTRLPATPTQQKMAAEIKPLQEAYDKASGLDAVGAFASIAAKRIAQFASNPKELAGSIVENLPNSAPGLAGGLAGGAAGGSVAGLPGALVGSVAGGTAGGYLIEQGAAMRDQILQAAQERGIDPRDAKALEPLVREQYQAFLEKSQLKGIGTAGTDAVLNAVTFGVAGIGERTLAKEARTLTEGVKAGTVNAADAATSLASIEARQAARTTIPARAVRGSGIIGAEMLGEGLSEAAGQQLAYGQVNPVDVIDESILGLGQGTGMAAGRGLWNRVTGQPTADTVEKSIASAQAEISRQRQAQAQQNLNTATNASEAAAAADDLAGSVDELTSAVDAYLQSSTAPAAAMTPEQRRIAAQQAVQQRLDTEAGIPQTEREGVPIEGVLPAPPLREPGNALDIPGLRNRADNVSTLLTQAGTEPSAFDRQMLTERASAELGPQRDRALGDFVDLTPMTPREAQNRLTALREQIANEGGNALELRLVQHPSEPGKVAITRQALPNLDLSAGETQPTVSQDEANARLESAAQVQQARAARLEGVPSTEAIDRVLRNIEERGGVASPVEAQIIEAAGIGRPYDRIDPGLAPTQTVDERLTGATGIELTREPGQVALDRFNQQANETQNRLSGSDFEARAAETAAQRERETEQAIEQTSQPAAPPAAEDVISALRTPGLMRTAEQVSVLRQARARYSPSEFSALEQTVKTDNSILERAANAPFQLTPQERERLRVLRESGIQRSAQRGVETVNDGGTEHRINIVDTGSLGVQGRMLAQLARVFGKRIVAFTSDTLKADGFVRNGDNKSVYLNVDSQISPLAVFGHELTHLLKRDNPEAYAAIQAVVERELGEGAMAQFEQEYGEGANIEELTSDLVGNRFQEADFWQAVFDEVAAQNPEGARGIITRLVAAITRAVNAFVKSVRQPGFQADSYVKDLEAVKRAATQALAQYVQSQREAAVQADAAPETVAAPEGGAVTLSNERDLPRRSREYEGRLWGGAYSAARYERESKFRGGTPAKRAIESARQEYNRLRTQAGLPEVTDWSKPPEQLLQNSPTGNTPPSRERIKPSRQRLIDTASLEGALKLALSRAWPKGRDLKVAIQQQVLDAAAAAGIDVTQDTPQARAYLLDVGIKDALTALQQNPNAIGWYDLKTRQALAVMALVHPKIATNEEARFAFTWALAVTSNGQKVDKNFELAEAAYETYERTGNMPSNLQAGQAQKAINDGLELFNELRDAWGMDNLRKFMQTNFTVSEITGIAKRLKPGGEHADVTVVGAAILGPKIGNGFFSNLYGNFDALTMDRWLIRTWGRWTGTLIKAMPELTDKARDRLKAVIDQLQDNRAEAARLSGLVDFSLDADVNLDQLSRAVQEASMIPATREQLNQSELGLELRKAGNSLAKYLDGQKEAPSGPTERKFIRAIFQDILSELKKTDAYKDLTMADLQAALWYAEKRLYETAKENPQELAADEDVEGYADDEAPDYANAAAAVARQKGVSDRRVNAALRRVENERSVGSRSADQRSSEVGQAAGAGQQGTARGFTRQEKQRFIGERAVLRARADRVGTQGVPGSYSGDGGTDGGRVRFLKSLGVTYTQRWKIGRAAGTVFRANNLPAPEFVELVSTPQNAQRFYDAIAANKAALRFGAAVSVYPTDEYQGMRLFLSEDGKSGVAVKPDGDIVSVFSTGGAGRAVLELAVAAGGRKLDAFDTILPKFYAPHGFKAVARTRWNNDYAPDGWNKATFQPFNNGEPDVVFMVYDPAKMDAEYTKRDGRVMQGEDGYDRAVAAQTREMRRVRRGNPNAQLSRQRGVLERTPELEQAAQGLREGTVTREQYEELVNALKPVTPYKEVPTPATEADMRRALTSDKVERIGAPSAQLKAGDPVGLRLDIPAYANHGVWVVSVHDQVPGFAAGKSIGYESVAAVTNPTFGVVETAALNIAGGKPKATIAVMKGDWKPVTEKQATATAKMAMKSGNWVQVGMDPTRHAYFYDRASMEPVVSADEAVQIGPLVLAKNPVYGKKSDFRFSRQRQTDTPAFRRWFGDSKVVDENGEPLVVYHGTDAQFSAFDMGRARDGAHFFTPNESHAATFGNPGAYFLSISNPLEISQDDLDAAWDAEHPNGEQDDRNLLPRDFVPDFVRQAREGGYDGLIIRDMGDRDIQSDMYLPLSPTQIKSATGNNGNFDPSNPDITASRQRIKWSEPKVDDVEREDNLTGTSPWSRNTFSGAPRLLYGEALDGDKLVGRAMIGVYDDTLEIDKIWVAEDRRRSGVAKQLIDEAKARTGIDKVWAPNTTDDGAGFMAGITASRQRQTDTPAFRRWFGDSKVVDENGEPLVVYHGSPNDISKFEASDTDGVYFSSDPDYAGGFADVKADVTGGNATLYPVYLSIKNPLLLDGENQDQWARYTQRGYDKRELQRQGYDGVVMRYADGEVEAMAFSPTQIKSATGNRGTFDPTNPDITMSRQRTPLGFYSALAEGVDKIQTKAAPAAGWKDAIKGLVNKGLAKADEVEWSGVNDWLDLQQGKVTREQVADYLRQGGVQVEETVLAPGVPFTQLVDRKEYWVLDDYDENLESKHGRYQLPGGMHYREVLLALPAKRELGDWEVRKADASDPQDWDVVSTKTGASYPIYNTPTREAAMRKAAEMVGKIPEGAVKYRTLHWDQPNVLAHLRVNDRVDADGKRVLFVEEIQSDWAQAGRKRGFGDTPAAPFVARFKTATVVPKQEEREHTDQRGNVKKRFVDVGYAVMYDGREVQTTYDREDAEKAAIYLNEKRELASNTEGWLNLALKRVIAMAVDSGYDKVAFINGQQSADRYDLSEQVRKITGTVLSDGRLQVDTEAINGEGPSFIADSEQDLADKIGKEPAERLMKKFEEDDQEDTPGRQVSISGLDLKVGGQGMIAFYDQIVPAAVKKLIGKMGGRMETVSILAKDLSSVDLAIDRMHAERGDPPVKRKRSDQPGFTITPEMRAAVNEGLPLFSRRRNIFGQPAPQSAWASPGSESLRGITAVTGYDKDAAIYNLLDKMVDTKRVVDAIKAAVGSIGDQWDAYLQEELYYGRTAKQTEDFLSDELSPLLQDMSRRGVTVDEFEEYLHNRFAEERNVQIAKVNPSMPDGGSGIDTGDARAYLAGLDPIRRQTLEDLASRIDAITKGTRDLLRSSGLETNETIDAWERAYSKYVPLQREDLDFVSDGGPGTGQGYQVRGPSSKRATGSRKPVANILANVAMQRERAIVRAEKSRVSRAVYGLAVQNPNIDFWLAVDPAGQKDPAKAVADLVRMGINPIDAQNIIEEPTQPYLDPRTGLVTQRVNPLLRGSANVLAVRIDGVEKYVFFNPSDERAQRMVTALKNLDADQLGQVLSTMAVVSRYIASVNTQYNPVFGVINFSRDLGSAALNLSTTPLANDKKAVLSNTPAALRGIYSDLRSRGAGKGPATGTWATLWEEFQRVGGQTGYRDLYSNVQERGKALEKELRKVSEGKAKQFGRAIFDWLSDYNTTMENAVRLSAYKVALDKGMSKERAASVAKNLTVNFNRKGRIAAQAGALYAFFNAAMRGTARMYETMRGPAGKKIFWGGLLLGSAQALLLATAGFDEDEPPDFQRERNLIIPLGGKQYASIPMPLGFHVIPNTSRVLTEWMLSGWKSPTKRVGQITGAFLDAFNPIGNAGWSMQTITPTAFDWLAALAENKDWTGKRIALEDRSDLAPTPGYTRAKETSTWLSKELSYYLNLATGGTKYTKGLFSPTPDQLDYLAGFATGGVGRELMKVEQMTRSAATGEELPPYKVPLLGRFYGDAESKAAESNRFYENLRRLNDHEAEIKGRRQDKESTVEYRAANPESRLVQLANRTERDVQELRKRRREMLEKGASKESIKIMEARIAARMKRFNDRVREVSQQ